MLKVCFYTFISLLSLSVNAQITGTQPASSTLSNTYPVVRLDFLSGAALDPIPLDFPFFLEGTLPAGTKGRILIQILDRTVNNPCDNDINRALNNVNAAVNAGWNVGLVAENGTFRLFIGDLYNARRDQYKLFVVYERIATSEQLLIARKQFTDDLQRYLIDDATTIRGFIRNLVDPTVATVIKNKFYAAIPSSGFAWEAQSNTFLSINNTPSSSDIALAGKIIENVENLETKKINIPIKISTAKTELKKLFQDSNFHIQVNASGDAKWITLENAIQVNIDHVIECLALYGEVKPDCADRITNSTDPDELDHIQVVYFQMMQEILRLATLPTITNATLKAKIKNAGRAMDDVLSDYRELRDLLKDRSGYVKAMTDQINVYYTTNFTVAGSKSFDIETRANWYVGFDLGAFYAYDLEEFSPYIGANIYLKRINKLTPFSMLRAKYNPKGMLLNKQMFLYRFAILLGLTSKLEATEVSRFKALGQRGIVIGGGFRLYESLRINFGTLLFKQTDKNPIVDTERLSWTPFIGLSLDISLRNLVTTPFR